MKIRIKQSLILKSILDCATLPLTSHLLLLPTIHPLQKIDLTSAANQFLKRSVPALDALSFHRWRMKQVHHRVILLLIEVYMGLVCCFAGVSVSFFEGPCPEIINSRSMH